METVLSMIFITPSHLFYICMYVSNRDLYVPRTVPGPCLYQVNKFNHMEEKRTLHRRDTENSPLIKRLDLCKSLFTYVPAIQSTKHMQVILTFIGVLA